MGRRNAIRPKGLSSPRGVRIRALLCIGTVLGLGAVGTLAAWTDEATATATFSAGTLALKLAAVPGGTLADSVAVTSMNMTGMYPGVSRAGMVEVANSGTVPLAYLLAGTASNGAGGLGGDLGSALTVSIYTGGTATNNGLAGTCSGTLIGTANIPLAGPLLATARPLAPATTEALCLLVALPAAAATELQGTTTTATFTFTGSIGS
ncbi:SipW-dependent-type signal peptide-containing protein [Arthrobacter sp. ZGTC131]|uniref:SipW-dependent-type signal peptide-containing protein n=1 Tax=Arthrobacter sp. ZGTC131 TaxID=2058898 RepID=UPI000CE2F1A7|nr:SipW-dependent-type signal peptide-containing protein [Arthrobacter sp. ZGTC131]